ncbi:glycoside hydrolase family 15 protein [Corynebacterium pilosum]|uniref:Glycoside hydrolase 15-related protein n=1 Tax=Corynebacterium pilosum TaxID=35756 RepID=A0A376CLJ1_9CORY|nr:glycoside hydrolase family 15 protein [Corynebacterium pilosum]STC68989.1 Glycoside hydrolase 15-related protein [Corynebacterium pilosum]
MASTPLEQYALLSDTNTAALVSRGGSVDWLCMPRFDSQAMFARLLGDTDNGHWTITVSGGKVTDWGYREDTFILETTWESDTGTARVTDFMPVGTGGVFFQNADLLRRVECLSGEVDVNVAIRTRFHYGQAVPFVRYADVDGDGVEEMLAVAGPDAVYIRGPRLEHDEEHGHHVNSFHLSEGETLQWVMLWAPSYEDKPDSPDYSQALESTTKFWRDWIGGLETVGKYSDDVRRSLLVLRALTDSVTGGIVAAPTTSLPEEFGGERNWDYRYVWLRDSALTIEVLVQSGFHDRAGEWRDWLLRAIAGDTSQLRIMYGLRGERHLPELELDHLSGYEDSRPVRIGNGASEQFQADVVGEVMIALEMLRDAGIEEDEFTWKLQKALLEYQEDNFDTPDYGIWEMRSEPGMFTHGRAMMWAAFDRGIKAVEKHGFDGPVDRWRELRDKLYDEIMTRGYNEELGFFTQRYDNTEVDASLLQLAQIGFVDYTDPKMLATVERVEQELIDDAGFLHRYVTGTGSDGLEGSEYPFLMCSFWLIEQYAKSGRVEDAVEKMDRVLAVGSPLGLFAEEYSPEHGRLAGNYPQAFSHLGLVRAAHAVSQV